LSFYLDANVLVALLVPEPLSIRAENFLAENRNPYIVSDFAAAEFSSAISRRVRMSEISPGNARIALSSIDDWIERSVHWVDIEAADITKATAFLRRLDLPLLTPDAIHIAIAQRIGATLVTFDRQMAASARAIGAAVAEP
jgi:predicted nucleic acid-binding protein